MAGKSTTLRITKGHTKLIARLLEFDCGVIVRSKGVEVGIVSVYYEKDGTGPEVAKGIDDESNIHVLKACTIPRLTIEHLPTTIANERIFAVRRRRKAA